VTASEKKRAAHLKQAFDITPIEWDKVSSFQGGVCFCCRRKPIGKRLSTDHNHTSGLFRGLLCHACNALLGKIENNFKRYGLHKVPGLTVEGVLIALHAYLSDPPAVEALQRQVFGYPGKIGTQAYRKWVKKRAKEAK
jgi:hypothetical protein